MAKLPDDARSILSIEVFHVPSEDSADITTLALRFSHCIGDPSVLHTVNEVIIERMGEEMLRLLLPVKPEGATEH